MPENEPYSRAPERFVTTNWSVVLAAGHAAGPDSRAALAELCETYWYPLYSHVRRRGLSADKAQDLIQAFFVELLERELVQVADRQRGRFRSFLLAALNHFQAKEWRRDHTQKRGGGGVTLLLDFQAAEDRYLDEPSHELTAERIYERHWALTLINRAVTRLSKELAQAGKGEQFERLKPYLGDGEGNVPYHELGEALGLTEGAVKVAVYRLRRRCRELIRAEIAQTVVRPEDIEEELRDLFAAVGT